MKSFTIFGLCIAVASAHPTSSPASNAGTIAARAPAGFACAGYHWLDQTKDTCESIGKQYGITAAQVQAWNTFSFNCSDIKAEFTYSAVCIKELSPSKVGPQDFDAFNIIVRPKDATVKAWWADKYLYSDISVNKTSDNFLGKFALHNRGLTRDNSPALPYVVGIFEGNGFSAANHAIGVVTLSYGFDFAGDYLMFDNAEKGKVCETKDKTTGLAKASLLWDRPGQPSTCKDGKLYEVRFMKVPVAPNTCS